MQPYGDHRRGEALIYHGVTIADVRAMAAQAQSRPPLAISALCGVQAIVFVSESRDNSPAQKWGVRGVRYELFKVKIGDKTYYGTYRLEAGVAVHVTSMFGSKSAPRSKEWPGDVAQRLLKEIVAENATELQKVAA